MYINLSSIVRFSKSLRQGVPYKAENWHALSHEQYFSKHRFLDICRCAFSIEQELRIQSHLHTAVMKCASELNVKSKTYQNVCLIKWSIDNYWGIVTTSLENFRGGRGGGLKSQLFISQKKYISICILQICVQFNFDIHSNQNQQS